ncbi:uncharacterized protein LOC110691177 isoform X1 [Chenopodium quinoa]|uniref:Uncharacterized protein n=2 Tax=Chenopodium quinoa TaxID=63459 RepID=A0A803N9U6_CHEQI|nr:uncharacterized protein LOC110691177 isoform X1 [Chenopodium quinoa]
MEGSTSSQSSGITGGDLSNCVEQEEILNLELFEKEPKSSEWTDEKHSMYLKSIEASFVQQLYRSLNSSGLTSHMKQSSPMKYSKHNKSHVEDKRIKYGMGEPPPKEARKCRRLLQNQWIKHFSSGDHQIMQGDTSFDNQPINCEGRAIYTCTLANISDGFPVCPTIGDSSVGEEFSGQNFSEEDDEEVTCRLRSTKRLKTFDALAENNE